MGGRMDGWMDGWMDAGREGGREGWTEGWMDGWMHTQTDKADPDGSQKHLCADGNDEDYADDGADSLDYDHRVNGDQ